MLFVLGDTGTQALDISYKHRRLTDPLRLQVLASPHCAFEFFFEFLQLIQVLMLDFSELSLNDVELLFVFERGFAEPVGELSSLCCVQILVIVTVLVL